MGILSTIKEWINLVLSSRAREDFDVTPITTKEMESFIKMCMDIYQSNPSWLDGDNHIKTVNFAKSVCSETARLTTLATSIKIEGSVRAEWLQEQIDDIYFELRRWVEYGCACGTLVLKPHEEGIEFVMPDSFVITATDGDKITGIVFRDSSFDGERKKYYTRLEYHRFEKTNNAQIYKISNRCYESDSKTAIGNPVPIEATPWVGLSEEVIAENVEKPLFSGFRTRAANNVDISSPLGMPIFADAIEENILSGFLNLTNQR